MLTCPDDAPARALRARWAQLEVAEPELELGLAARRLGVTPLALLEARINDGFAPLTPEWTSLLTNLCAFGRVSARTAHADVVLELAGTFAAPRIASDLLAFDGPQLFLHADLRHWSAAYAFELLTRVRARRGLAFCDRDGELAWLLELVTGSNRSVLDAFVDVFGDRDERRATPVVRAAEQRGAGPCETLEALATRWAASGRSDMLDQLLWRHGLAYERVLRQRARGHAERLEPRALPALLQQAHRRSIPLRALAGSESVTLAGRLDGDLTAAGEWWNVVSANGALHLRASAVREVWLLHGARRSVEVFGASRRPLLSLAEWDETSGGDSLGWTSVLLALGVPSPSSSTPRVG